MKNEIKYYDIRIEIEDGDTIYLIEDNYGLNVLLNMAKELISIMEERKLTDEEDTDWYRITDAIGYYVCANYDIPMVAETVISIYDNETNEPFVESLEPFIYY
jgi:hypothetical protein